MPKISLPKEVLSKESLSSLPSKEKSEYLSNAIKKILEMNPEGITSSQIREATGYTYSTIWHHLEMLSAMEQCSKKQRGNVDIYFPNKIIMEIDEKIINAKNNSALSLRIVENIYGKYLNICRETEGRIGGSSVVSGILIPDFMIKDFKSAVERAEKKFNSKSS